MAFAFVYPEIQASLSAHNLHLTNPPITCAGLEGEEIINAALGHAHAVERWPKPALQNLCTQM